MGTYPSREKPIAGETALADPTLLRAEIVVLDVVYQGWMAWRRFKMLELTQTFAGASVHRARQSYYQARGIALGAMGDLFEVRSVGAADGSHFRDCSGGDLLELGSATSSGN